MKSAQAFSPLTRDVAVVLGKRIREGRLERRWTVADLAERVGVTRWTISRVEKGDLSVALGSVFEAAVLTGVPLFSDDRSDLERLATETDLKLALLPTRARRPPAPDDF